MIGILLAALLNYYILSSHDIHLIAAIACFISIVIGFLCIWYGSIYLTRPISQLNDAVTRVSKGDLSVQIDRRKYPHQKAAFHNEIDELAHNFNTMTKDLQQIEIMRQEFISNVSHELKTPVASYQVSVSYYWIRPSLKKSNKSYWNSCSLKPSVYHACVMIY